MTGGLARCASLWLLLAASLGLAHWGAAAQEKSGLPYKPPTPPAGAVRVRVPLTDQVTGFCHFNARVPLPRTKKTQAGTKLMTIDGQTLPREAEITVVFEARPGRSIVSVKKWLEWGFERPPPGKNALLPELLIPAVQLLPAPKKHHDVWIRLTQVPLELVDLPGDGDAILGSDLLLSVSDLTRHAEHRWLPHLHLGELYLDLTVPVGQLRYPGSSDLPLVGQRVDSTDSRTAVAAVISPNGPPVLTYVALNGKDRYPLPDGRPMPVRGVVASVLNCPGGIAMTLGTARGCGVELTEQKVPGQGASFKTTVARGRLQELRLELFLAPEYSIARDLVLKDLEVWVDLEDTDHLVWFGPQFWRDHFASPIYACNSSRVWKLYGRVDPMRLADPKTRRPLNKP